MLDTIAALIATASIAVAIFAAGVVLYHILFPSTNRHR